jgi:hypothetical protein
MKDKLLKFVILTAALFTICFPLLAHHGLAEFDRGQLVSVKGIVTDYEFTNPHAEIYIDTRDAKGNVEKWQGEMTSPNMLTRAGWTRTTLHVHDEVTLIGYPSKSGDPILRVQKVLAADARELPRHSHPGASK